MKTLKTHFDSYFVFILGCLTFLVRGGGASGNIGYIDPNVYSGLGINIRGILEADGPNYYSSRIAHVMFLKLFVFFFDSIGPILFLGFTTACTALVCYLITRRTIPNLNKPNAMILAVTMICLPSFYLDSKWTYVNITFHLFIALTIYFIVSQNEIKHNFFFAAFVAVIALNIHLKGALLVFCVFTSAMILRNSETQKKIVLIREIVAGAITGLLFIEALFQIALGRLSTQISWYHQIKLFMQLSGQRSGEWLSIMDMVRSGKTPWTVLIFIFAILNMLLVAYLQVKRTAIASAPAFNFVAVFSGLGSISFFIYQEILKYPILGTFWYFDTFWIIQITTLLSMVSWLAIAKFKSERAMFSILAIFSAVYFFPANFLIPGNLSWIEKDLQKMILWLFVIAIAIAIGAVFFRNKKFQTAVPLMVIILVLWSSHKQETSFTSLMRQRSMFNYETEVDFFKDQTWLVNEWIEFDGKNGLVNAPIWYENDPRGYLGALQSGTGFAQTRLTLATEISGTSLLDWSVNISKLDYVLYFYMSDIGDNNKNQKIITDYGCTFNGVNQLSPSGLVVMRVYKCV